MRLIKYCKITAEKEVKKKNLQTAYFVMDWTLDAILFDSMSIIRRFKAFIRIQLIKFTQ